MRTRFSDTDTESDVEHFFVLPLLTSRELLGIPDTAVMTKASLSTIEIGKGSNKKRYVPDYLVYNDGLPCMVVEAKRPDQTLQSALDEAQLYALEINKNFPSGVNPCAIVCATNGRSVWFADWDASEQIREFDTSDIKIGSKELEAVQKIACWDALIKSTSRLKRKITPKELQRAAEHLGENRVNLAKSGHNSLYAELEPILRKYFDPKDRELENLIVEKAYVSTEETTKYERSFEDHLRTRVIPLDDERSVEVKTNKRDAGTFGKILTQRTEDNQPFMQLVIGGVGSGKTTFLKRFFAHLLPSEIKRRVVYCRINFNVAPDDTDDLENWVCEYFIEHFRRHYSHVIDITTEAGIQSVFSQEIKNNSGAYAFLKKSSLKDYHKRIAEDILKWMSDPRVFAKAIARSVGGDRNCSLIVSFDNVDRRDRDSQLRIFQVGQWFMNSTRSLCIMTMRDETFEAYKDEKPLDAFLKSGNFYIRPPRFVDMVSKRLSLAISELSSSADETASYEIDGIGEVRYPKTAVGSYLTSVFVDLFKKRRNISTVLEGLSGRNARKSLEMFISILTSAHFDTRDFTQSALTTGQHTIQENTLLRALMRTNYLYFTPSHGFVRNLFDFPLTSSDMNHFLKSEILKFLIENRKKVGDTRYEGYFTVSFLQDEFSKFGFQKSDIRDTIDMLIADELIMAERQTREKVSTQSSVRVRPSGYVHMSILSGRLEYLSACALITPISDGQTAKQIGEKWQINVPHTDAKHGMKSEAALLFVQYLKSEQSRVTAGHVGLADETKPGWLLLKRATEAIGFTHGQTLLGEPAEIEFESLFDQ
ncbi:type I restriction enzyme HsdR N-terminal domain-containing protein [Aestuariivita sp.]|jgi:hypothetical protein|uniref:type I restriction enzyme HsdR N-terminal domain-containing protein n=1 Tax=Aestuariivita sp. TaxID=1872407 RepID=UPI00216E3416|nr:type I restriction enzyme HsdR N-terminal domain-containing protein [Aestuariivita sp.]MCE8006627.1 cell division protein ZapE [Aestuariivita sp.]